MHVDAEVSLLHAASLFQNRHMKFLPIIVPGSATVLALISHVEILEVCGRHVKSVPSTDIGDMKTWLGCLRCGCQSCLCWGC